jgi:hypothetical protein
MIYAVRLAGCFALILTFLPAAFWVSLAKPPRNALKRSNVLANARGFERES